MLHLARLSRFGTKKALAFNQGGDAPGYRKLLRVPRVAAPTCKALCQSFFRALVTSPQWITCRCTQQSSIDTPPLHRMTTVVRFTILLAITGTDEHGY
jgi:hypothetical protein